MTLNELVDSVSKLRGWKTISAQDDGVTLTIPKAGNRKQDVAVTEFKDEGQAMIRFITRIGKTERLEPERMRAARELNLRMLHGCLAVDGAQLVMTEPRPLKTSTPDTTGDAL